MMEQIDWIEEFEKKKKRWYYRKHVQQNIERKIRRLDFVCDVCRRDVVIEIELQTGIHDGLKCICGKIYPLGVKLVNYWIGPYDGRRHTT